MSDHQYDSLRYAVEHKLVYPRMQSKLETFIEVHINTWTGLIGSWIITYVCMKYLPLSIFWQTNLVVALCTVWSLLRGYVIRRYFNSRLENK